MKSLLYFYSLFLIFTYIGCSSYSFRGAHTIPPKVSVQNNEKYQMRNYSLDVHKGLSSWSVAQFSGSKVVKSDIEKELIEKYKNKFNNDNNGNLFDVKINCKPTQCSLSGLFPYFLSLGFYPANIVNYKDSCDVLVSINDNVKKGEVKFRSNGWLSVFTPFGLYKIDQADEYNGMNRFGSGILQAPHLNKECLEKQKSVFISEVAKEISTCIVEIENDEALSDLTKQKKNVINTKEDK